MQCFERLLRKGGQGKVIIAQPNVYRSGWDELKAALAERVRPGDGSLEERTLKLRVEGGEQDVWLTKDSGGLFSTRLLLYTPAAATEAEATVYTAEPPTGTPLVEPLGGSREL